MSAPELAGMPPESYQYVEHIKDEIDAYGKNNPQRILIYIHGGLNSPYGSINRAVQLSDGILAADSYPIFINWQSSLMSSYWEHVWYVRQGEHWGYNPISMPSHRSTSARTSCARWPRRRSHTSR